MIVSCRRRATDPAPADLIDTLRGGMPMAGNRPIVSSRKGMVAAAHPLAAFAGARMIREGGNAFDAIVATAGALNVVEPFMSGLAGLGMATFYASREKRVRTLDFITPVPAAFDAGQCTEDTLAHGAKASGVPGSLAGWCKLLDAYGTKSRAEVFAPAIELARDGFPLTSLFGEILDLWGELRMENPEWVRVYTDGRGGVPADGILRQPELAETYEAIVAEGPAHLHGGALGRRMAAHLDEAGGFISMADLEAVDPMWRDPLVVDYRGLGVHTLPPPAESFQVLQTLRILEAFDLASMDHNGIDHLDTVFRAIRLAAGQRIAHNNGPIETIEPLLADEAVAALRSRVGDGKPVSGPTEKFDDAPDSVRAQKRENTTSFSAADAEGNMVCLTQSLGSGYGSGVVIPGTGVCMNNFLNWGDLNPDSPNFLRAGQQWGMCLAPTISLDGDEPVLALGTPGSYGILQTQVQAIVHHLDFGLALQDAIEAPRARLWNGTRVEVESRIAPEVMEGLRARGHDAQPADPFIRIVGGMHALRRNPATGALTGAADPRRDGYAAAP